MLLCTYTAGNLCLTIYAEDATTGGIVGENEECEGRNVATQPSKTTTTRKIQVMQ